MNKKDLSFIIFQAIEGNEFPFNRFFEETFQKLHLKLQKLTHSKEDIKDIYVMSMQKFWERFIINQEKIPDNATGYIYVMCKNALLLKKREAWSSVLLSDNPNMYYKKLEINELEVYKNEESNYELLQKKALQIALEELSTKCKTLIENELDKDTKLKELMVELGYANYQALVQAKYNCKKRLIKKVQKVLNSLSTKKV